MKITKSLEQHGADQARKSFLSGILVLSASTVIVKIIGLAYKIPMFSLLGAEGMGYFNSAYEIYALLCVISTAGLPVALSVLISREKERGDTSKIQAIFKCALALFFVLGISGTLSVFLFSEQISIWIGNPRARECIVAISPSLLLICLCSAVRGYFQGHSNMTPTAVSQLVEACGKLVFGLLLAFLALEKGYREETIASFAALGLTISLVISTIYLFLKKKDHTKNSERCSFCPKDKTVFYSLMRIAIPITLSSAVLSITRLIDMTMILRRLQSIGYSAKEANMVYGSYTTLVVPIFNLVPSLITPISLALIPKLCAAVQRNDKHDIGMTTDSSLRMTLLFSLPASLAISAFSAPILSLLFVNEIETVDKVAPLLSVIGFSIVFSCLITTTNALLQSNGKNAYPIISMAVGAVIKIVVAYLLIGNEDVGVFGAPISTLACDVTIVSLNMIYLFKINRRAGVSLKYEKRSMVLAPLICSAVSIGCGMLFYHNNLVLNINQTVSFIITVFISVVIYFGALIICGNINMSELLTYIRKRKKNKGEEK